MSTIRSEVAIVGGGLMGSWTAYFLRKRGRSVTLAEKGVIGAQASGVNFGNLRIQGRVLHQLPLSLRAHEYWERFEELTGESCEFTPTGHLRIAFNAKEAATLEEYAASARPHGLALELMDQAGLRRRWPWLAKAVAGSFSARDAAANPRVTATAVARAARALGAEILDGTRVTAIERVNGRFRLSTESGAVIESEVLVNAAGAWANDIAQCFGESAPIFAAGPAQFVTEALPYFIEPSVQSVDGSAIFRQVPRGNVVVAGYPRGSSDPVANRAPVAPRKTVAHMQGLGELVPALAACHIIRVWSGIEGYLPDMLPVIGPSGTTPGLFHAFAFCGHGFQLAPGVGLVLSELIVDGKSPTPLAGFEITRFKGATEEAAQFRREFDTSMLPARPGA
ncbi:MAG TPA: FAD-dependent oxidoreductase [Stellaceae bacterium]|nr:FAD-dependent oxidoreductase [Stellaceae bacterium]